jgi:DUF1680 family protein
MIIAWWKIKFPISLIGEYQMYKTIKLTLAAILFLALAGCDEDVESIKISPSTEKTEQVEVMKDYPYTPVPFTAVNFTDKFWAPRMETNRSVTIPYAFEKCEESKRFYHFERAAKVLKGEKIDDLSPPGLAFDDTDPYKVLEGAAFGLSVKYDAEMDAYLDKVIALIASAQEPDGYLYTARTICPEKPHDWAGTKRWEKVKQLSHELYNMGHLYEAAVAHYEATGKRSLLDIAIKNADLLCETFGPGKNEDAPGHQIIEMGLVRLYRATGKEEYLDLAKFFLDTKGPGDGEYSQAHVKIVDQDEAVGHAVRATYMYCGVADVAAITKSKPYMDAMDKIWENVVTKKFYITGGIGATHSGEAFGPNYYLPNMSAYCETCAAIGNVYWNHRMFLLHGDSKYIDVMERSLYNGLISGISLEGKDFFYPNPLESKGQHKRSPWFGCACCPGNIARFLASVPRYAYAHKDKSVYVNLFAQGTADVELPGNKVNIAQKTKYPWQGKVKMTVKPQKKENFDICVRIPGWAMNKPVPSDLYSYKSKSTEAVTMKVNGKDIPVELEDGYVKLSRAWAEGDTIELNLPMPIRKVEAHPNVKADVDRFSVERGPIVYCLEGADHPDRLVRNLLFDENVDLSISFKPELLGGVQIIKGKANALKLADDSEELIKTPVGFTAIPYYAWANRGANEMTVWLPTKEEDVAIKPHPTIASKSKVTASKGTGNPQCLVDQTEPKNSHDKGEGMYHWWSQRGNKQWVQFDFEEPTELSGIEVYWLDDSRNGGGCGVPQSWRLVYKDGAEWKQVVDGNGYAVEEDMFNKTAFTKVKTTSVKIELQLTENLSGGVLEVRFQ